MVTIRTRIKEIIKESELGIDNISADFIDHLDKKVEGLILDAVKRAKDNGRKTIMGRDV
tara:strand:+ start:410 stop:586 length:177 start_codon:yes stop_codon:yes gene_type:complete